MRSILSVLIVAAVASNSLAGDYIPDLPAGSVKYEPAKFTQSIAVSSNRDEILPFPIASLKDTRWHQPGGLLGVKGWTAEKFRTLPTGSSVKTWVGDITVNNSIPVGFNPQLNRFIQPPTYNDDGSYVTYTQKNRGLKREYPVGTRFDEVLRADGKVFEHRVRVKDKSGWDSRVEFEDAAARPSGYTGLTVTCSSCHDEAGTGKYNSGLVPGSDTVLSDPLEWRLWTTVKVEERSPKPEQRVEKPKPNAVAKAAIPAVTSVKPAPVIEPEPTRSLRSGIVPAPPVTALPVAPLPRVIPIPSTYVGVPYLFPESRPPFPR